MAPSATLTEGSVAYTDSFDDSPSRKRVKLDHNTVSQDYRESNAVRSHPLGVKPLGNAIVSTVNSKSCAGHWARLPEELVQILIEQLSAWELLRLSHTCKYLYAFGSSDELWRGLFVSSSPTDFQWRGSWRSTHLSLPKGYVPRFDCSHVFSDVLHRPFYCTVASLAEFAKGIPPKNAIPRMTDLNLDAFNDGWANRPFILTAPVREWPAYRDWTVASLLEKHGETKFRAEAVDWPLVTYFDYMYDCRDESPLYLFDRSFAEKMGTSFHKGSSNAEYWPPDCFSEDLFDVLEGQRPDSRWLIIGPERSGSTFHKDPNGTSAWNAVLTGSKYWIMFPSSPELPPPPGIILSADQSEITSPLSIAEYLLSFHEIARATPGCREGICYAGEVLHVPSGWFHLVLNLEDSIAITQNFVPRTKLVDVMRFLRDCPEQVSGFRDTVTDVFGLFVSGLAKRFPELLQKASSALESGGSARRGKWEALTSQEHSGGAGSGGGFSFGFGESDSES